MSNEINKFVQFSSVGARAVGSIYAGERILKILPTIFNNHLFAKEPISKNDPILEHFSVHDLFKLPNVLTPPKEENLYENADDFIKLYPMFTKLRVSAGVKQIKSNYIVAYNERYEFCGVGVWPCLGLFHNSLQSNCICYCSNANSGEIIVRAIKDIQAGELLQMPRSNLNSLIYSRTNDIGKLLNSGDPVLYIEARMLCIEQNLEIHNPLRMQSSWLLGKYLTEMNNSTKSMECLNELYDAFELLPEICKYTLFYANLLHELANCYHLKLSTKNRLLSCGFIVKASHLFSILCGKEHTIEYRETCQKVSEHLHQLDFDERTRIRSIYGCHSLIIGNEVIDLTTLCEIKI